MLKKIICDEDFYKNDYKETTVKLISAFFLVDLLFCTADCMKRQRDVIRNCQKRYLKLNNLFRRLM